MAKIQVTLTLEPTAEFNYHRANSGLTVYVYNPALNGGSDMLLSESGVSGVYKNFSVDAGAYQLYTGGNHTTGTRQTQFEPIIAEEISTSGIKNDAVTSGKLGTDVVSDIDGKAALVHTHQSSQILSQLAASLGVGTEIEELLLAIVGSQTELDYSSKDLAGHIEGTDSALEHESADIKHDNGIASDTNLSAEALYLRAGRKYQVDIKVIASGTTYTWTKNAMRGLEGIPLTDLFAIDPTTTEVFMKGRNATNVITKTSGVDYAINTTGSGLTEQVDNIVFSGLADTKEYMFSVQFKTHNVNPA